MKKEVGLTNNWVLNITQSRLDISPKAYDELHRLEEKRKQQEKEQKTQNKEKKSKYSCL